MHSNESERALPINRRALAIWEDALGPDHPVTATGLINLAGSFIELDRFDEALPLEIRALSIFEKTKGFTHPFTANALSNIGSTYVGLGEGERALPLQLRAVAILEGRLGPDHPETALKLAQAGVNLYELHLLDPAAAFLKASVNAYQSTRARVSRIDRTALTEYTESIVGAYQRLAEVLTDQGRLSEAQMVLDMLKEDEQFDFIRRAGDADPRRTRIGYTPTEQKWIGRYREIADRLAALGKEEQTPTDTPSGGCEVDVLARHLQNL